MYVVADRLLEKMKMVIDGHQQIVEVQRAFNEEYPFLNLDFFPQSYRARRSKGKSNGAMPAEVVIGQCQIDGKSRVTITSQMTVAELEENISKVFGLEIKVLRRSGKSWLDTALTKNWSLEKQNTLGMELSEKEVNYFKGLPPGTGSL